MKDSTKPPKSIWPYAIIGYYVFFVGVVAAFIGFAVKQDVHLVRKDYYAAEIRYQEQLDQLNRTAQLGRDVVIEYSSKHRKLGIKLPETHLAKNPIGEIKLYRPNDPAQDKSIALKLENDGKQFVDVDNIDNGSWRVELKWNADGKDYLKTQKIVVFNPPS